MSLRLRLAVAGALAVLLALGLTAWGLTQLFGAHVERRALVELSVLLDQILAGLERDDDGFHVARPPADPRFDQAYGGLYWQIESVSSIDRSRSLWDMALSLPPDTLDDASVHVHRLPGPGSTELLVLERSVLLPDRLGRGPLRVAVAMDAAELDVAQRDFMTDLLLYVGVLALALSAAGWVQLWIGLRPLRRLGSRVAALRAGGAQRIGSDWPQEVRPVAAEIDALLDAREAQTQRARLRAADLAHGLKTPLQALMGEAARLQEIGAMTQAAAIEDTARAMRRTVDRELARAQTEIRDVDASADAGHVVEGLIAVLRRTPDGRHLTWRQDIAPGHTVALHEAELAEALGALSENAARHARGKVAFSARNEAGFTFLTVSDDGPGIPVEKIEALKQRHARLDESGSGLGLSIASEIAEAAGGSLVLANVASGLSATLKLPSKRTLPATPVVDVGG